MQIALKNTHTHTLLEFMNLAKLQGTKPTYHSQLYLYSLAMNNLKRKLRKQLHLNIENKIIGNN